MQGSINKSYFQCGDSITELDDLTLDTSEAERELAALQRSAEITAQTVLTLTRRGYATLSLFSRAAGQAVSVSLDLLIQSTFLFAEALTAQASAESLLGSPRALLLYGMATLFFYRATVLQGQRSEIDNAFDSLLTAANIWI